MTASSHLKFPALIVAVVFSAHASAQTYFGNKLDNAAPASLIIPTTNVPQPAPAPQPLPDAPQPEQNSVPLTAVDYQKLAVQKFPELKDPSSALNRKFIQEVGELKKSNPAYFNNPQWPLLLAQSINEASNPIIPGLNTSATPTPQPRRAKPTPDPTPTPAPEIKPFSQLDKENVRLEAKVQDANKVDRSYRSGWGYSSTDKTVTKEVAITVVQIGKPKLPLTVDVFFVHGGAGSESFVPGGSEKVDSGEGLVTFSNSTKNSRTTDYDGLNSFEGQKIIGWLARATAADGRTLGVAASSEKYLTIAKDPKRIASLVKRSK